MSTEPAGGAVTVAGDATQPGPGLIDPGGRGSAAGLGGSLIASLKEQQRSLLTRHRLALAEIERRREIAGAAVSAGIDLASSNRWRSVDCSVYLAGHVDDQGGVHGPEVADTDSEATADHLAASDPVFTIGMLHAAEKVLKIHAPEMSRACLACQTVERLDCPVCDMAWPCTHAAVFITVLIPGEAG
jgi:hypothetical protein